MHYHSRLILSLAFSMSWTGRCSGDDIILQLPERQSIEVSTEPVNCILSLERERMLIGCFADDDVRVLSLSEEEVVWDFELFPVIGGVIDAHERVFLCTSCIDFPVECWNSQNWAKIFHVEEDADIAYCVAVSRDGRRLAFALGEGGIAVCEANYGNLIARLNDGSTEQIVGLSFNHDGHRLAAADSGDNSVEIWDINDEKVVEQVVAPSESDYPSYFLEFVGKDERESLLMVHPEGGPGIYDGEITRIVVDGLPKPDEYLFGCISRDGRHLAMDCGRRGVLVWHLESRQPVGIAAQNGERFTAAEFTRDGQSLVTGGIDGVVRVYEIPQD